VPKGKARIRTQMSAALSTDEVERAAVIFTDIGRKLGVI
jgi:glycine C-acetyltransferase